MNKLATIGYETDTQGGMINRLKAADVELVVDVRAVASSRKAGFSKTLLGNSLKAEGIDYLHLRPLGTPKAGRDAARAGRTDEMRQIFNAHLEEPEAQLALAQAIELAGQKRIALLCYEDDPNCCHRQIVAQRIRERLKCEVVDL
ncbi:MULTISPECIES: DUF488 family protein [unclassified Caulobacter]|uniref:DUF488 domain-containing protein n=1 Tax=unclassified Caulobacter TaxID=2648921 RepID=UPI000700E0FD|nr:MULTISPECIES: DUF488 domain-containing protein [unclassified Caulobacter]KQV62585.1 hypothetical protein ASC62_03350 [Caulobacter sp. Root342]KQV65406.1 hypothetical protein ASC70_16950 [Caulobacter sp. Root343]